jgi:hypothetical protein
MTPEIVYNLARLKSIKGTATFSKDKVYRYLLTRKWGQTGRAVNFVMCNPSVADATTLDRTVSKCLYWSILWGFHMLLVTNVFSVCSTNPQAIYDIDDPIGPENNDYISLAMEWAKNSNGMVICAFGNHATYLSRNLTVQLEAANIGVPLYCLELNKEDIPKHPLYIKKEIVPKIWKYACVPASINVLQE